MGASINGCVLPGSTSSWVAPVTFGCITETVSMAASCVSTTSAFSAETRVEMPL